MTKLKKGPELYAAIRRLHAEGKTAREAAAALGLSVDTIYLHHGLLGLPRFQHSKARDCSARLEIVRKLHAERKSAAQIAEVLGISIKTAQNDRRRLGLLPFGRRPPQELYEMIRRLHWEGKTAKEAAAILGLGISATNHHRALLGLPPFEAPPRNTRKDGWGDDEVAALAKAIADGEQPAVIAKRLGRSVEAVFTKRRKLGLPRFTRPAKTPPLRPSWSAERTALLARLRQQRVSFAGCARKLGVTRCAAIGAAHRYLQETA